MKLQAGFFMLYFHCYIKSFTFLYALMELQDSDVCEGSL